MERYDLTTYSTLQKAPLNPPAWVFGPVWTVLYIMIATSAWLYFRGRPTTAGGWLFGSQLVLNVAWPYVFFKQEEFCLAAGIIIAMIVLVALTIGEFSKRSKWAAWLLVPYLAWISFASYLNLYVCVAN